MIALYGFNTHTHTQWVKGVNYYLIPCWFCKFAHLQRILQRSIIFMV